MEYVCRILKRDPDRPLDERELIEFGVEDAEAFGKAVQAFAGLVGAAGTPEAAAKLIRNHRLPPKVVLLGR